MNKTANYQLTIIVPVYNEEGNILRLEKELGEFLKNAKVTSCVLFVNDGSKDDSERLIRDVCGRNEAFFFLNLARNGGLSAAMKAGIDNSFSRWVGYIDADLQTTPQDFNKLLEFVDQYEIANGFRRMMTHDGVEDTGSPLKVLRTDYAKRIPFFTGMHRFLPALIQLQEGQVKQVPVRHFPRIAGKSKYNLANRLVGPFKDCFAYRWMRKRYINYQVAENNLNS